MPMARQKNPKHCRGEKSQRAVKGPVHGEAGSFQLLQQQHQAQTHTSRNLGEEQGGSWI